MPASARRAPSPSATDGRFLLAVDPGSDEITSFQVRRDGSLRFADRIGSGGDHPISVTIHNRLVYVVNDGGSGNIAGFRIDHDGDLSALGGSVEPLSTSASAPAEIAFSPNGRFLVVTEKATNRITTYTIGWNGRARAPQWTSSAGETPFGFDFDNRGHLIVSEAYGGAPDASTVSSYRVGWSGASLIDGPVATTETAACWVVVTSNGRFAYATNTGSGTVTGYAVARNGDLAILDADGVTGVSGGAPSDAALSAGSDFLYVRTGGFGPHVPRDSRRKPRRPRLDNGPGRDRRPRRRLTNGAPRASNVHHDAGAVMPSRHRLSGRCPARRGLGGQRLDEPAGDQDLRRDPLGEGRSSCRRTTRDRTLP